MTKPNLEIMVISDALGETAERICQAAQAQFPYAVFKIEKFPIITTQSLLAGILKQAKRKQAVVVYTFSDNRLATYTKEFCQANQLAFFDGLTGLIDILAQKTNQAPLEKAGLNHVVDDKYFKRIDAIEFAVNFDDGRNPKGFLEADIVLLGVSRTSKTPLSLYLANQGYKVANLPLVQKTKIPQELFDCDPKKIIGLTNDATILQDIRQERMKSYGLNRETPYSKMENIEAELASAKKLYQRLGCLVINVAHKSIEETATLIIESQKEN